MPLTRAQRKEIEATREAVKREIQEWEHRVWRAEAVLKAAQAQLNGAQGYLRRVEDQLGASADEANSE